MNYKTYTDTERNKLANDNAEPLAQLTLDVFSKYCAANPPPKSDKDIGAFLNHLTFSMGNEIQKIAPDADFKTLSEVASELAIATFETLIDVAKLKFAPKQ